MSTISFGGLASGLDTDSIISALIEAAQQPITLAEAKVSDLSTKLNSYNKISSYLSSIKTAAGAIDTEREFFTLSATSADTTKINATASSSASPGSYDLIVNNLAQAERTYSDAFSAKDTAGLFGDGTLTIQVGASGTPVNITVGATDTLEDVASKINDEDVAVNASIVFDGTDYRLVVMGEDTGADNTISFTEGGTLSLNLDDPTNEKQAAANASVTMDGMDFESATNQFTEMIVGVTIDLEDSTGGDTVTVSVDVDADSMASKIQTLISAYNNLAGFLHDQFQYQGEARSDTLMGDSAARGIKSSLQSIIISEVSDITSDYKTLASIGVSTDSDGTLSFDSTEFKEALAADPQGVIDLFTYDDGDDDLATDGIALRIYNTANQMLLDPEGIVSIRIDGINDSIDAQEERIDNLERQVEAYEDTIRAQFAAMEQAMAEINAQSDYLAAQ